MPPKDTFVYKFHSNTEIEVPAMKHYTVFFNHAYIQTEIRTAIFTASLADYFPKIFER